MAELNIFAGHTCATCPLSLKDNDTRMCRAAPPQLNIMVAYAIQPAHRPSAAKPAKDGKPAIEGDPGAPEIHHPRVAGYNSAFPQVQDKMWCGHHPEIQKSLMRGRLTI